LQWIETGVVIKVGVSLLLIVIVIRVSGLKVLILLASLSLASIAFFPERKVEIVAVQAHPIPLSGLIVRFICFRLGLSVFNWGRIKILHNV
jgi:hypothetical protein